MHSLTIDPSTVAAGSDEPAGGFENGKPWRFPPPCKDWEAAVHYLRPNRKAVDEAWDIRKQEMAEDRANDLLKPDLKLPRNTRRTIKVRYRGRHSARN